ncbi:MAG TPA: class I SAM-dependent methyltransferase [Opitutaceae bacterium]|nr:class I SAM-dependent methyltransferase [Opitutaceae bacterium]
MSGDPKKISAQTVRADFNDLLAVVHYTRAAHELGLWASERALIEKYLPDKTSALLEAGCGAGRVTLGLWEMGYRNLTAFDFAEELVDQARSLAAERHADGAAGITFLHADATDLTTCHLMDDKPAGPPGSQRGQKCHLLDDTFAGALFMFNGLMQIPGRERRLAALRELHRVSRAGAPLIFTSHDRDSSPMEQALWRLEALRWEKGTQDSRLVEFGDRYFEDESGRTFMHLPVRGEILEDLGSTGWTHEFDAMRRDLAAESRAVLNFSDECRFWVARKR